jgi:hypothetical protein
MGGPEGTKAMKNMKQSDIGGFLVALAIIMGASFFGTMAAGLALIWLFGLA